MMLKLKLHNLCFAYTSANPIINQVTCSFRSGRFYSIIGPNGSGKTTLFDLISGFIEPDTGTIELDGQPMDHYSKKELARHMALVSQDYSINFPFHVKEVVMMGRHPYIPRFSGPSQKDIQIVETVIDQCGIRHLMNRKINELSGGERQRCVFARALAQDASILLLDEAFSSMDICHTLQMLQLVKDMVKEKNITVISVFHDLNLASSWSNDIIMIRQGRIKAFGKSQEVLTQEAIKRVFNVDSIVSFNPDVRVKQVSYPSV